MVDPRPVSGHQPTVGAALSSAELCVVRRGTAGAKADVWRMPLQPLNGDGAGWPALTGALRELSRTLGVEGGRLEVALMPPLTETRRLDLPPMGEHELRLLLSRNAARYFVGARSAQLVGVAKMSARSTGPLGGVVASAAPLRLVAALHAAAREAGWAIEAVSPAEGAWSLAAEALWPRAGRHGSHLLVCSDDRTELLLLDQGRLAGVRRFRGGAADAALVAAAVHAEGASRKGWTQGAVSAVGARGPREELARALASTGLAVSPPPAEWAERASQPDLLAAEFAGPRAAPLLRTEATRASRREQANRVFLRLAGTSVALLLLAALFVLWGDKRQLRAVQAERAAIKPQLAATLVGRTSVETAFRQLSALAAAQRSAPRWSVILAGVSDHLDDDSYLTTMRGRDDSLMVEGVALRASKAFDSLVGVPGLSAVRAAAPVRRESPQGGAAVERFTIAATVAPPGAPGLRPATANAPPKVAP